jgi:hypothetical protein
MRRLTLPFIVIALLSGRAFPASVEDIVYEPRVLANDNSKEKVQAEVVEFQQSEPVVQARGAATPAQVTISYEEGAFPIVKVEDEKRSDEKLAKEAALIIRFVSLRLGGHSRAYSTFLAINERNVCRASLRARCPGIENFSSTIAFDWVEEIGWCAAFPDFQKTEGVTIAIVVDGDLAWIYQIPKKKSEDQRSTIVFRFDSLELRPGVKGAFRSAYDTLAKKVVATGKNADLWFVFQKSLHDQYSIEWKTPVELNPGTFFE